MHFEAAFLSLGFSAISTLVVVVGALAALRQLRYMRYGNEMHTLMALHREWNEEAMIIARQFVGFELSAALEDPSFVDELRASSVGGRAQHVVSLANFYERVAMYVNGGALSEELAVMEFGVSATNYWPKMRPALAIFRTTRPLPGFVAIPRWTRWSPRQTPRSTRAPHLRSVARIPPRKGGSAPLPVLFSSCGRSTRCSSPTISKSQRPSIGSKAKT